MYSRKSEGPGMEPWGNPAWTGDILVKISHLEPPKDAYYWENKK